MFWFKNNEILTYFFLIIVGYCIGKMFSKRCESLIYESDLRCETHKIPRGITATNYCNNNGYEDCGKFCGGDGGRNWWPSIHFGDCKLTEYHCYSDN